jgi:hypothetical protein
MTSAEKFRSIVKGKNVMTPAVLRYGETPTKVFELSEGTGFEGEPIFGLTVIDWGTDPADRKRNDELSDCFSSREFAEAVIAGLK